MLLERRKLLAKLTVVLLRTCNGVALHRHAFSWLLRAHDNPGWAAVLPTVLGGVSAASWLFAAFVGVGKAVAPWLGYSGFMLLYLATVWAAVTVALALVRSRLANRLGPATVLPSTF